MLRALAVLCLALSVAACDEDTGTTPPPVDVPLPPGTWFMHSANGLALPAEISRRFVGLVDEQTILDSARFTITGLGDWEQRYWTRVLHIGVLDRRELVIDEGTWASAGGINTFTSTLRGRTFGITVIDDDEIVSDEPMVFFPNAINVTGVYRTTPPAP